MQSRHLQTNLFTPGYLKLVEVNNNNDKPLGQKRFISGLQNARNILDSLERSIEKTRRYEERLLECKAGHPHGHSSEESWNTFVEEEYRSKSSKETKRSRSQVDLAESWSTMSIVCLQYQYEELSKRYAALLRSHDARCRAAEARDAALARLRRRVRTTEARAARTHRALLAVGDRFLALRDRRFAQKIQYEEAMRCLKESLENVLLMARKARHDLDVELGRAMAAERDVTRAMLLAEIRKCNRLCLENMRLKTHLVDISPHQSWTSSCFTSNR